MKIIKKIVCWDSDLTILENVMLLCYRVFTYIFPSGLLLYSLVISKLIDDKISVTAKLGCSGLFLLIAMILIAVILLGRHFKKVIEKLDEKILNCIDIE